MIDTEQRLILHTCLADQDFQEWLGATGLAHHRSVTGLEEIIQTADRGRGEINRMVGILCKAPRLVFPREALAKECFGDTSPENLSRVTEYIYHVRQRIRPLDLTVFKNVGYSVGVDRFLLHRQHIPLIYGLWWDMGYKVPRSALAQAMYGSDDRRAKDSVRDYVAELRQSILPETSLAIDILSGKYPGYRLRGRDLRPLSELHTFLPTSLSLKFQDWLAKDDVGIVVKGGYSELSLQLGKILGSDEMLLFDALRRYAGYIVPPHYLSYILHDVQHRIGQVRFTLYNLRAKLSFPEAIQTFPDMGYSFGVKKVRLGRKPLIVLACLLRKVGEYQSESDIVNSFRREGVRPKANTLEVSIRQIKYVLDSSCYLIEDRGQTSDRLFRLVRK